jgi:hypothetical protein
MDVDLKLQTRQARAQFHAATRGVLRQLGQATADGARAGAPEASGFLASTVVAVGPGQPGVAARDELHGGSRKQAAAVPAAGPDEAIVAVAALYAIVVELRHPFLLQAAITAIARLDAILRAEVLRG